MLQDFEVLRKEGFHVGEKHFRCAWLFVADLKSIWLVLGFGNTTPREYGGVEEPPLPLPALPALLEALPSERAKQATPSTSEDSEGTLILLN
jgi:hypothetical protein